MPLDMSVLQQPVLFLDVSGLQQPVLPPVRVCFTAACAAPEVLDVSVLQQPVLPFNVSLLQQSLLSLDVSMRLFYSSLYCSRTEVSGLQLLVLHLDVFVQQQPVLCQEVKYAVIIDDCTICTLYFCTNATFFGSDPYFFIAGSGSAVKECGSVTQVHSPHPYIVLLKVLPKSLCYWNKKLAYKISWPSSCQASP